MKIREANTADVEALADIASRTFIDAYDDLEPEEAQSYIDQFLSVEAFRVHCDSSSSRVFVADDEKLLGYALLRAGDSPLEHPANTRQNVKSNASGYLSTRGIRGKASDPGYWLKRWNNPPKMDSIVCG
jgi:hypothetical protein